MAEIPVQRKGGMPWWGWALLAVLAVALLIWLFTSMNDADREEAVNLRAPAVLAAADAPATTIAAARSAEPGRAVALEGVRVLSVLGDRGFLVGPSAEESVLVVLDQTPTPNTPTEGRYDVTAGQMVDVNGVVRSVRDIPGVIQNLPPNTRTVIYAHSLDA